MRANVLRTALAVALVAAAATLAAQGPASYSPPKTPWGDPDLQGIWPGTDMVGVPFERPERFGARLYLTDQELQEREAQASKQAELDVLDFDLEKPPAEIVAMGDVGGVTSPPPHWLERGVPSRQSSLIVEPANGRMPAMTAEGKERQKGSGGTYLKQTGWNQASELGPYDRCISRGVVGSMMPVVYNNGNQIIQTPGYVVFRNEMIHESRVIPLDGRPHMPASIRMYMGDSRGRWEGDTLVVETTNFTDRVAIGSNGAGYPGDPGYHSPALRVTERFTRTAADTLVYEATVDDPQTWVRPWTLRIPLMRGEDPHLFEYACHEGNYAMRNILSAARTEDKK
jgi:hypothetical protein